MQVECYLIQEVDTENPTEDEEQVERELDLTGLDDAELDKVRVVFITYSLQHSPLVPRPQNVVSLISTRTRTRPTAGGDGCERQLLKSGKKEGLRVLESADCAGLFTYAANPTMNFLFYLIFYLIRSSLRTQTYFRQSFLSPEKERLRGRETTAGNTSSFAGYPARG